MAFKGLDGYSHGENSQNSSIKIEIDGSRVDLPDASYVREADMVREGMDLVLEGPDGTIVIEGYFSADPAPDLVAPDGATLTSNLIESFAKSPSQFASNGGMSDESPVGSVNEVSGEATVTRLDGTVETVTIGTPIFEGDVIETDADGAVNIVFIDETSFAVSEDARFAIDEYVFDPSTQAGSTNFSVLKGVFVFTSGLIGRDDPDDVNIDTPVGSIGIRGTIIAGDVDSGEITVVEGAIVLRDFSGNEMTLASQFETARFNPSAGTIDNMGQMAANDVSQKFVSVSTVSPNLFSSINDAAAEQADVNQVQDEAQQNNVEEAQQSGSDDGASSAVQDEQNAEGESSGEGEGVNTQDAGESGVEEQPVSADGTEGETEVSVPQSTDTMETTFGQDDSGMTSDTSGTPSGETAASSSGDGVTTSSGSGEGATSGPLPPSGTSYDEPVDPNALDSGEVPNPAPVSSQYLTDGHPFLSGAVEDQSWQYDFSNEFRDNDIVRYELDQATKDALQNAGELDSYSFQNGVLNLDIADNLSSDVIFNINVRAVDSAGQTSGWESYEVQAVGDASSLGGMLDGVSDSNGVFAGTDGGETVYIGSSDDVSGSDVFMGKGADDVQLIAGENNRVYLGEGNNTVSLSLEAYTNTIVGGGGVDSFSVRGNSASFDNELYGMGGNDTFTFDNVSRLQGATSSAVIDGGSGRDTLALGSNTAGDIDFSSLDGDIIRNIEVVDTANSKGNVLTLSYDDVIDMTDDRDTLIIKADNNDTVNFDSLGHNMKDVGTQEFGGNSYDVYTDGKVTLLVSHDDSSGLSPNLAGDLA